MPRYIIKLTKDNKDYYLEWSTIVDAPITYGMSLEAFKKYYKEEYGKHGMKELPERLERVEKNGCSIISKDYTVNDLISSNRAGDDEKTLTKKQLIDKYCKEEYWEPKE